MGRGLLQFDKQAVALELEVADVVAEGGDEEVHLTVAALGFLAQLAGFARQLAKAARGGCQRPAERQASHGRPGRLRRGAAGRRRAAGLVACWVGSGAHGRVRSAGLRG